MTTTWEPATQDEVMNHPNWLSSINLKEYNLQAHIIYNGSPLRVLLFWNDELIFHEDTYNPQWARDYTTLDVMVDMLQWFVMDYSDSPMEDECTPKQNEWYGSNDCNELNHLLQDYISDDCEEHNDSIIELNGCHIHC